MKNLRFSMANLLPWITAAQGSEQRFAESVFIRGFSSSLDLLLFLKYRQTWLLFEKANWTNDYQRVVF